MFEKKFLDAEPLKVHAAIKIVPRTGVQPARPLQDTRA